MAVTDGMLEHTELHAGHAGLHSSTYLGTCTCINISIISAYDRYLKVTIVCGY